MLILHVYIYIINIINIILNYLIIVFILTYTIHFYIKVYKNIQFKVSVEELKKMLNKKKQYCTYMMCCTKPLTDEQTLADFNIGPNSTINML